MILYKRRKPYICLDIYKSEKKKKKKKKKKKNKKKYLIIKY